MGIGMVIIVSKDDADLLKTIADKLGESVFRIGDIVSGSGSVILENV